MDCLFGGFGGSVRYFISMLMALAAATIHAEVQHYKGKAVTSEGKVAYLEEHDVTFEASRIRSSRTCYFNTSAKLIATLDADYARSVELPTYEFRDLRFGSSEGLRLIGDRYEIFYAEAGKSEKKAFLERTNGVYSCQGWHYFLVQNLDRFRSASELKLALVLPGQLDAWDFEIRKDSVEGKVLSTTLKVDNFFSFALPKLRLRYDVESRRLLRYEGLSNLTDDDGKSQNVIITYDYADDGKLEDRVK